MLFYLVFIHPHPSPLPTRYEECLVQKEAAKSTAMKLSDKVSPGVRLKLWGFTLIHTLSAGFDFDVEYPQERSVTNTDHFKAYTHGLLSFHLLTFRLHKSTP